MIVIKQFSRYGRVAVGSAVTDYITFSILLFFGAGILPAQMVARIAGGLVSFTLNKYWSFSTRSAGTVIMEWRRFLLLYAFSYILALGIIYTLVEHLGLGPYPAKVIADVSCFVVNFIVMQRYVFSSVQGLTYYVRNLFKSP